MELYEIIIAVICSVVLCGLVILISILGYEKTPNINNTEETTTTGFAQKMKSLTQEKEEQIFSQIYNRDEVKANLFLNYLPDLIEKRARQREYSCLLPFEQDTVNKILGYRLDLYIPSLGNKPFFNLFSVDRLFAKIKEYCEENGFEYFFDYIGSIDRTIYISWNI